MFNIPETVWAKIIGYLDLRKDIPNLGLASKGFNAVTMNFLSRLISHCKLLVDTTFSNADLNDWWEANIAPLGLMLAKMRAAKDLNDELYAQILEQVKQIYASANEKLFDVYSSKHKEDECLKFPFITSNLADLFDYVKLACLGKFEQDPRFEQSPYSQGLIDRFHAELDQGGVWVKEALQSLITAYAAHKECEPLEYPELDRVNFDDHDLIHWWLTHYKHLIQLSSCNNYAGFIERLILVQTQANQKMVKFSNITALRYLDVLDLDVNCQYRHGDTALVTSLNAGAIKDAMFLIGRGANVNQTADDGRAPLHFAAGLLSVGYIGLLLDNDAEIDAVDNNGATPLLVAAQAAHEGECHREHPAINLLLERGADPNLRDHNGLCAARLLDDKAPDPGPEPAEINAASDDNKPCAVF